MSKLDPIIAVKNVEASSKWFQSVFNWKSLHGGDHFDILVAENDEIVLCLHPWSRDGHPTMLNPALTPGNGLILYFRTANMVAIRENAAHMAYPIEEEIHLNPNSSQLEFSLRDPDGYYITISEFHQYEA
jgi:hypothetical protein